MVRADFSIHGMDCAEEVAALRNELSRLPGVEGLEFNVLHGRMTITYAEDAIRPDDLIATVAKTGMRAQPWRERQDTTQGENTFWSRRGRVLMTAISGAMLALAEIVHPLDALTDEGAKPLDRKPSGGPLEGEPVLAGIGAEPGLEPPRQLVERSARNGEEIVGLGQRPHRGEQVAPP
jgi:copper chaperone CopZ